MEIILLCGWKNSIKDVLFLQAGGKNALSDDGLICTDIVLLPLTTTFLDLGLLGGNLSAY